jgi:hypothetical protein
VMDRCLYSPECVEGLFSEVRTGLRSVASWLRWSAMARIREAGRKGGDAAMLFVTLLSTRPGNTFQEGVARRLQWEYPEGANVVAEYWLETEAPRVIAVVEAESMEPFGQIRMDWGDMFEIEVFPVVTAEQGLEMARQAMASGQG